MVLTDEQQALLSDMLELRHLQGKLQEKQNEKNAALKLQNIAFQEALKKIDEEYNPQLILLSNQVDAKKNDLDAKATGMGKPGFWAWLGF